MRLWRDDLEELEGIMREAYPETGVRTDQYELDRIADLAQAKERRINAVSFTVEKKVHLLIRRSGGTLAILEPTLADRGLAADLENVTDRCRKFGGLLSPKPRLGRWILYLISIAALAILPFWPTVFWPSFVEESKLDLPPETGWAVIPLLLLFGYLGFRSATNVIQTRSRTEAPPWIRRNFDALLTNAIVSAVFLFVGIWLGRALD